MKRFCILGQSNYAVAILLDTLAHQEKESFSVDIVANIPSEANDSLSYPYAIAGIATREVYYTNWSDDNYDNYLIGSIGKARYSIFSFFKKTFGIQTDAYKPLLHPSSTCASTVKIGHGVHISPLSVIAPYATLGDFTVINRNVSVGHHTHLEDFVTFNPGVNIAGCCHVGKGVTIGAGATVLDSISIGAGSIIGAGSLVTKDIPENVVAYGVPAKIIKHL